MRREAIAAPPTISFEKDHLGSLNQAQHVRGGRATLTADAPVVDDALLLDYQLATNAILHSRPGHSERIFSVRQSSTLGAMHD